MPSAVAFDDYTSRPTGRSISETTIVPESAGAGGGACAATPNPPSNANTSKRMVIGGEGSSKYRGGVNPLIDSVAT